MKRSRKHHQVCTVEVEHNGIRHQGEYTVANGVVEVIYGKAKNSALSRGLAPEHEARQLLLEILDENN